jgi:hypothetical protein
MRETEKPLITLCAISAASAAIALVGMAFLPRPFAPMDHLSILLGSPRLGVNELAAYKSYVSNNLTLDSFYLLAHSLMWVGMAQLVSRRTTSLGKLVLLSGLSGAIFDFLENELRWAAIGALLAGNLPSQSYVAIWQIVLACSFWFLFLAAGFAGIGLAGRSRSANVVAGWSFAGILAASLTYKLGHFYSFLWLIVWHILCAYFLWGSRVAHESSPTAAEGHAL